MTLSSNLLKMGRTLTGRKLSGELYDDLLCFVMIVIRAIFHELGNHAFLKSMLKTLQKGVLERISRDLHYVRREKV